MTIDELRQAYEQAEDTDPRGPCHTTVADVAELLEPGLSMSTSPTAEQCLMLGQMAGYVWRGEDGWYRSAASKTVAELLVKLCAQGVPLGVAADVIGDAMQVGAEEYSG